jgi:hypothetical protein
VSHGAPHRCHRLVRRRGAGRHAGGVGGGPDPARRGGGHRAQPRRARSRGASIP